MPHTKDGRDVNVGDTLNLPVKVLDVQKAEEYCNCTVETLHPMVPTNQNNQIVVNTKQLVGLQVSPHMATVEGDPKRLIAGAVVGFGFMDIKDYAQHVVNAIKKGGDAAIAVAEAGFKMYQAFTDRDLTKVMAAFQEGGDKLKAVLSAIKEEFQLHEVHGDVERPDGSDPGAGDATGTATAAPDVQ